MQYGAESSLVVAILTLRSRGGDTTLVLDLTIAIAASGEVGFKADLSALGCFSLSIAGSFLPFGK
jgi:hypothetical protein